MKKRIWIILIVILALLFVPIPTGVYKDGGTRTYTALTYKIVAWNRMTGYSTYNETKVYWFPYNFKSIDGLWYYEEEYVEYGFTATILEIHENSVLVAPDNGNAAAQICEKISFNTKNLPPLDIKVGSQVTVLYKGGIMESYPAQIHATNWSLLPENN